MPSSIAASLVAAGLFLAGAASAEPLAPNPLGRVMILEYHKIDRPEGRWTRTPENFRRDLRALWERGIAGLAVAVGFGSAIALLLRLVYVIPGYWICLRSEEGMLLEHLEEAYGRYREQVGALLPRRRRGRPGRPLAPEERDRSARRGGPRGGDRR